MLSCHKCFISSPLLLSSHHSSSLDFLIDCHAMLCYAIIDTYPSFRPSVRPMMQYFLFITFFLLFLSFLPSMPLVHSLEYLLFYTHSLLLLLPRLHHLDVYLRLYHLPNQPFYFIDTNLCTSDLSPFSLL